MRTYRAFLRYLYPYRRFSLNHGRRIINPYALQDGDEDERILMLAGIARSPQDARLMMRKHKATRAAQVLAVVDRRRRFEGPRERLVRLLRKIDGDDRRDLIGNREEATARIHISYRYRTDDE